MLQFYTPWKQQKTGAQTQLNSIAFEISKQIKVQEDTSYQKSYFYDSYTRHQIKITNKKKS